MSEKGVVEPKFAVGDTVYYIRRCGVEVLGVVEQVYVYGAESSRTYGGASVFDNHQLCNEVVAYRLRMPKAIAEVIGHPVTVGESRCYSVSAEEE